LQQDGSNDCGDAAHDERIQPRARPDQAQVVAAVDHAESDDARHCFYDDGQPQDDADPERRFVL